VNTQIMGGDDPWGFTEICLRLVLSVLLVVLFLP
jgi:hypothetical protein